MNRMDVQSLLASQIPEIKQSLCSLTGHCDAYASMQLLSSFTRQMALAHHFRQVQRCMQVADKIYQEGSALERNAVENVYVYSFELLYAACAPKEWRVVRAVIPPNLLGLYIKQVNGSAI